MQKRQKRQRRMTAGGKAAAQPPALPAAAAPEPSAADNSGEAAGQVADAWQRWLCPDNPAIFAFVLQSMPAHIVTTMRSVDPAAMFPEHFPDRLPTPVMDAWSSLWRQPAAAQPAQPGAAQPVVQPAAAQPAAAQPLLQPAALPPQQEQPAAAGDADAGSAASDDGSEEDDEGLPSCHSSNPCYGCSWCYDNVALPLYSCYSGSSDSERVQPGKRITWRGAIAQAGALRAVVAEGL